VARYKLTIEYAGTRYSGWQIQKNARTIQGELNRAVSEVAVRGHFETYGSGRTDAGVHALAQVAHLDLAVVMPEATLLMRLNDALPADINILAVERVAPRFHARHSAVARSYLYQVATRRTAFAKPFVWWVREPLDLDAMRQVTLDLSGFADFRSFTDDDPDEKSTLVEVQRVDMARAGSLLLIRVVGSHFLWKMVRRMIGVIVECGRGGIDARDVPGLFQDDAGLARLTAPASGLFLERVFYDRPPDAWPLAPAVIHID
jgi:tRNA pseudouridine38-40 synthase